MTVISILPLIVVSTLLVAVIVAFPAFNPLISPVAEQLTVDASLVEKVTSSLAFVDYNLSIGTVPNLPETITLAPETYKVVYSYKAEGASEFTTL